MRISSIRLEGLIEVFRSLWIIGKSPIGREFNTRPRITPAGSRNQPPIRTSDPNHAPRYLRNEISEERNSAGLLGELFAIDIIVLARSCGGDSFPRGETMRYAVILCLRKDPVRRLSSEFITLHQFGLNKFVEILKLTTQQLQVNSILDWPTANKSSMDSIEYRWWSCCNRLARPLDSLVGRSDK
jgi:hypothetical protein